MASRSLCLPPALTHFCTSATRGGSHGTGSSPRKYGTNGIIPEFTNIGDRGPDVSAEAPHRAREVGRHALGGVALHRLAHEAHQPERHAEPEADADHEPEETLEHRPTLRGCAGTAGRRVPFPMRMR